VLIPYRQNDIGKILENLVYHQLRILGYKVFVGKQGNKEIDFVADKNGQTTYIQVAYLIIDDTTHKREFDNLLSIKDNFRKVVVSMDKQVKSSIYKGIEHWNIRHFLLNFK
jgi:predicted AAA+ superfamily ATPase